MPGTGGFQTQVYPQPVMAVAGDFASMNPYFTFDAGPGGLVAGLAGVTVGAFAWVTAPLDPDDTGQIANSFGAGTVSGFVHRAQQALITKFLANAGTNIPQGYPVTLMTGGDFWVTNNGTTAAVAGQKAYASLASGLVSFAATGSPTNIATGTGAIITQTATITASISGDLMTVTGSGTQPLVAGAVLTGTGLPSNLKIVSQQSSGTGAGGGIGGNGVYVLNQGEQNIPSESITATYGVLTVSAVASGTFGVGDSITGSGVSVITTITQLGSGIGGTGTYYVTPGSGAGSGPIQAVGNVETKWIAMSGGAVGELVKISDHALG